MRPCKHECRADKLMFDQWTNKSRDVVQSMSATHIVQKVYSTPSLSCCQRRQQDQRLNYKMERGEKSFTRKRRLKTKFIGRSMQQVDLLTNIFFLHIQQECSNIIHFLRVFHFSSFFQHAFIPTKLGSIKQSWCRQLTKITNLERFLSTLDYISGNYLENN